ncbi:MAG TPA: carboxypeptidase-like regulatory domain-containing protein [Thermoanaerobaculia bacterium]
MAKIAPLLLALLLGSPVQDQTPKAFSEGCIKHRTEDGLYLQCPPPDGIEPEPPADEDRIPPEKSVTLHGCLPGLLPGERARVGLWVEHRGIERALLDSEGCYEVDGLAPGELTAKAAIRDTANVYRDRHAIGRISVQPGNEAVLDIDFHMGNHTFSGRVTASHPPKVFATLLLPDGTELITDDRLLEEGKFHFDRLREGTYRLRIVDFGGKIVADQPVEVPPDGEVVIELP